MVHGKVHLALVKEECPPARKYKVRHLMELYVEHTAAVLPDPYYGRDNGFEQVLDLVEDACEGLIRHIKRQGDPK